MAAKAGLVAIPWGENTLGARGHGMAMSVWTCDSKQGLMLVGENRELKLFLPSQAHREVTWQVQVGTDRWHS